jgi:hypothetical protein
LAISSGRVRLTGDQRLPELLIDKNAAGTQSLDLAGRTMRFDTGGLQGFALESSLNQSIGTAADGIYDSTAAARPGTRIGIAFESGSGVPMIMKLTLAGDADVNGVVDFNDLVVLAQNYNSDPGLLWDEGDFNYDTAVDFSDLVLLAQNYNTALPAAGAIPGATAGFEADLATAFASVPEPSSGLLAAAAAALAVARQTRRRRRASPMC